ncbi:hypothetical protein A3H10_04520 [Candidatus Uhrbacteria bacterium RIFCSPLOWO2_12_FULL_46_10]|uniref:HhH-GPD domain-containing protein n=1 Tax=Candidatus Uhrbacteria bacterium RIFCSPLOWO2_01_FULL_47_25 TaxID=1802402 RepID=A0A1F7UW25_9BACT|nr:MAG: hypothetical protein UX68_C0006G0009 [Parcubacteria group bacterium GW2011_GWA2_46_9]OGL59361.1 MAG: hypothetical protein A2752_05385 [Candidatus Uhrbacteria bacterium RIFCSPHIGHO2_01_FULL_46_23]OGL68996.1 MAG: hypothetical protein A3D60_04440 [Candidatus Uhrbacteria bacterium RIFCSPHIGHO2_02_FULL_47_29]OGL76701.1 MAG: hypothetical protein A3E96_00810 [Candidatus Uhrbacteria bacterium RIFCSPHIGHO2_12_FULL_46_13]OGL82493.1 MAG: hypothetical protein A2936_02440 [Candidatus Uhrbacteria bac
MGVTTEKRVVRRGSQSLLPLYRVMRCQYGHPRNQWGLWCKRRKTLAEKEEIIIGAILTQRTNWRNVELSITALKRVRAGRLKNLYKLAQKNPNKLADIIRSCGFYQTKVKYLRAVTGFFVKNGGLKPISKWPLNKLRVALLELHGVGPETADSILLYALNKPIFVVDEYTRRLIKRKNFVVPSLSYDHLQRFFMERLPKDYRLYQDFHAIIVVDGKNTGRP